MQHILPVIPLWLAHQSLSDEPVYFDFHEASTEDGIGELYMCPL